MKINDNYIVNFLCSAKNCQHPVLVELVIGKKEEKYQEQYNKIIKEQKFVGKIVSKLIISGKFKSFNLTKEMIKFKEKVKENSVEKHNFPLVINGKFNPIKGDLDSFDRKLPELSEIKAHNNRPNSKGRILERYQFKIGHKHIDPIRKYNNILDNISLEEQTE